MSHPRHSAAHGSLLEVHARGMRIAPTLSEHVLWQAICGHRLDPELRAVAYPNRQQPARLLGQVMVNRVSDLRIGLRSSTQAEEPNYSERLLQTGLSPHKSDKKR
jgi:hypothetical protein